MDISDILNTSFKAIIANKMRSGLTILGIVIGVTSVIILISLVTGLKSFITDTISSLGPNIIFVVPGKIGGARGPGGGQINRLTTQDVTGLRQKLQGQAEVSGAVQKATEVKYKDKNISDTVVSGVEANYSKIIQSITLTDGRFFTTSEQDSGKRVAVIGPTVKDKLFDGANPLGKQMLIGSNRYTVIGVTAPRGSNFGLDQDNVAIIPLSTAQKQFGATNISFIIMPPNPDKVKASIRN